MYVHTFIVLNYYYIYSFDRPYHFIPFKPRMRKSFPQTANHTGTGILVLPNLIYRLSQRGNTLGFRAKMGYLCLPPTDGDGNHLDGVTCI